MATGSHMRPPHKRLKQARNRWQPAATGSERMRRSSQSWRRAVVPILWNFEAFAAQRRGRPDGRVNWRLQGCGPRLDGGLDPPREVVDGGREAGDGVERAVFAPAGDVGNAIAVDREAEAGADDVGDGVDHDFGLLARVGVVVDPERVRGFVDHDPQLRVRRRGGVDDDPPDGSGIRSVCSAVFLLLVGLVVIRDN
jgi:hypothetical protein